jgi:hypothetical protein
MLKHLSQSTLCVCKQSKYSEALYAMHFLGYNIYIRVQQLHYFIRDQIGYSTDVLQLTVHFISV